MKKLLFILVGFLGLIFSCIVDAQAPKNVVYFIQVQSAIGPASQDYIHRGIETAEKNQAQALILQLDTPGGLSKSMQLIIQDILNSKVPVITYVAPSGAQAASAGTYILYASHIAAMAPGTNMGAATPVKLSLPFGDDNNKSEAKNKNKSTHELKALNNAKAYIRSLAELRNRNVNWAEQAVTQAASISAQQAWQNKVIDLVAQDIPDLLQKVNGMTVQLKRGPQVMQTQNAMVKMITPDWRTQFLAVITDPSVAYILLILGFYGLFFEFFNPGFVLPGVIGGICFIMGLYALQLLPINYAGLGLIILGLAFIVAEVFVPSYGSLGIGGIISFVMGSIMLLKHNEAGLTLPWQLIAGVAITTGLFVLLVLQLAVRARRRPVTSGIETLLGQEGVVEIMDGKAWIKIQGEFWQVAEQQNLSAGQKVIVTAVQGLKLVVK